MLKDQVDASGASVPWCRAMLAQGRMPGTARAHEKTVE
jgi:hypothetical protein